jgi:hypothetical protein
MTREEKTKLYLESFREAQKEATDALRARDEAGERLERANAACHAWKTIAEQAGIDLNARNNGAHPGNNRTEATPQSSSSEPIDPSRISKSEYVRLLIERAGTHGITSAEIKAEAAKAGVKAYVGFPYTVINKLKNNKKVATNAAGLLVLLPK